MVSQNPMVKYRFAVVFLTAGIIPNPLDIRFQKVSGLTIQVDTQTIQQGGDNMSFQHLPKGIKYNNIVLERGITIGSILTIDFNKTMSLFSFTPCHILITLLNHDNFPSAGWMAINAIPVKWSVSDLDADSNGVAIDIMELACERLQAIRV